MEYFLCASLCAKHCQIDIISTLLMKKLRLRVVKILPKVASKRWIWDLTLGLPDFIEANDIVVITAANNHGTFPLCVHFAKCLIDYCIKSVKQYQEAGTLIVIFSSGIWGSEKLRILCKKFVIVNAYIKKEDLKPTI